MRTKLYESKAFMVLRYITQRKSEEQIAAECDTSQATINRWLKRHGIHKSQR